MRPFVFAILFLAACIAVLIVIFRPYVRDRKKRGAVMNFDLTMRNYCFLLKTDRRDVIEKLSVRNLRDAPEYSFDANNLMIVFVHFGVRIEYQLSFVTIGCVTYLNVHRIKPLQARSNIPYMINGFFMDKIDAVPIEYSSFESLLQSCIAERSNI